MFRCRLVCSILLGLILCTGCSGRPGGGESSISLLTYNVLRPEWGGANKPAWTARLPAVLHHIRTVDPDFLGLQEESEEQLADILDGCPGLELAGVHPGIGGSICYKPDRWRLIDFTILRARERDPDHEIDFMRPLQVADFQRVADGRPLRVVNVHLTPFSAWARDRAMQVIAEHLDQHPMAGELVVMGDLNAVEGSSTLDLAHELIPGGMRAALFAVPPQMVSYPERVALVERCRSAGQRLKRHEEGNEVLDEAERQQLQGWIDEQSRWGTMHDFAGSTYAYRIDYILVSPGVQVLESGILARAHAGTWGSDHHPVYARVVLAE